MNNLKRPYKYREGQRKALDWFFDVPSMSDVILDVGCGIGTGMKHLISKGYDISGIDSDPGRVSFCLRRHLDVVCGDAETYNFGRIYNVFWLSHSLEHMKDPKTLIKNLLSRSTKRCRFYIVVPYPDLNPAEEHRASKELGLNINDSGKAFIKWLSGVGLKPYKAKFDDYREPELWIKCSRL